MTRKTVGYVELEWTCPNCGTRNRGTDKKCVACGLPQPADIAFEQQVQETLITDQAVAQQAQQGPDVHCPYCGTRNLAGAERCKQCGGDLVGGKARESGRVVGAHQDQPAPPVLCEACGSENPATARTCSTCGAVLKKPVAQPVPPTPVAGPAQAPRWLVPVLILAAIACIALFVLMGLRGGDSAPVAPNPTTIRQAVAEVTGVQWRRAILVQALVPVTREAWQDELPSGENLLGCEDRLREISPEPAPNSVEVCGTPYVVDTGTGLGEVVQDCEYQIYEPWCRYQTLAWVAAPAIVSEGLDFNPQWPAAGLAEEQREVGRDEEYVVTFQTEEGPVQLRVPSLEQLQQFTQGSRWTLEVDSRGRVVGVEALE